MSPKDLYPESRAKWKFYYPPLYRVQWTGSFDSGYLLSSVTFVKHEGNEGILLG